MEVKGLDNRGRGSSTSSPLFPCAIRIKSSLSTLRHGYLMACSGPALQHHVQHRGPRATACYARRSKFEAQGVDGCSDRPSARPRGGRRRLLSAVPILACGCSTCRRRNAMADRAFAESMAHSMVDYEAAVAPLKRQLFAQLLDGLARGAGGGSSCRGGGGAGDLPAVLEVGIGAGPNMPYLRRNGADIRVLGVDPNPFMRPHAEAAAARCTFPPSRLSLLEGTAEALPLEDGSVDAAICTLVLCSVDDVAAALAEVKRVLRPGGRFLFIEHTVAVPVRL